MEQKKFLMGLSFLFTAISAPYAQADCQVEIDAVITEIQAQHETLSEEDHVTVEASIGDMMFLCETGDTAAFNEKLTDAKIILGTQ